MTDDQQQPNEFPAPKPLPGSVYIRPGIDDRPDYDKVLSPEDKSAVARLAVHQPRRKVEASVTQAETQVAQMTSEGSPAAAAASVDTAVPDMGSAYVDMRDPVVSADGQRPNPGQVTRLSWGFAVGATIQRGCLPRGVLRWRPGTLREPGQSHWRGRRRRGGVGMGH